MLEVLLRRLEALSSSQEDCEQLLGGSAETDLAQVWSSLSNIMKGTKLKFTSRTVYILVSGHREARSSFKDLSPAEVLPIMLRIILA